MFAILLNKIIESQKIKQADLAKKLGIHPSQVSRYCSGESEPSFSMLKKISKVLEIDPYFFFNEKYDENIIDKVYSIKGAIYQLAALNIEKNCAILNVKFTISRFWDNKIVEIAKNNNLKFSINVISGIVKVDNLKKEFFCLEEYETLHFSENSVIQLIAIGNLEDFIKDLREVVDFTTLY